MASKIKNTAILISGSINSGKSTVAKLLAERLGDVAVVELDAIHDMFPWMPIPDALALIHDGGIALIRTFLKHGISVIVPYPMSRATHDLFVESLEDLNVQSRFFVLAPKMELALSNRGGRILTEWEKERIRHHYKIGIADPGFGTRIDTTDQTPEQTTDAILGLLD